MGADASVKSLEDFWHPAGTSTQNFDASPDFWTPLTSVANTQPQNEPLAAAGPWDFPEDNHPPSPPLAESWAIDPPLPWYDEHRAENPHLLVFSPPSAESLALRRGRWLAQLLDVPEPSRRRRFAAFFAEVFDLFPSKATFQTLADLALVGVDAEAVQDGCLFKLAFVDDPYLPFHRHGGSQPARAANPQQMLPWRRAVRMAEIAMRNPYDCIEDDWTNAWAALRPGHPAYWSFLDYIELRIRSAFILLPEGAEDQPRPDRIKFRAAFGCSNPQSRTGGLITLDRGLIGVLHQETWTPQIAARR